MDAVEHFIYEKTGTQREILLYLHQILAEELGLQPKIRYRIPFYYQKSWICYLNPLKEGGVEFVFLRGNELSNEQDLLDTKGRKQVRGITFRQVADVPLEAIYEIIQEALVLDETVPYRIRKNKPK